MVYAQPMKTIRHFPNYSITEGGQVYSTKRGTSRQLKPHNLSNGYVKVQLWSGKKGHQHYIHRLVADTYLPNPLELPEVNHKDGNPRNNNVDNLEWCTRAQNAQHAAQVLNKFHGCANHQSKLTEAEVTSIRSEYVPWVVSLTTLASKYNVSTTTIYDVVKHNVYTGVA